MKHLIDEVARQLHLNPAQYWHLRMLSALSIVPLVLVLYLAYRFWTKRRDNTL